ncbi:uncharacterized protein LOC106640507 [Copidosoma floridanum]|uniref:uncharacterized protein LOC106640507 n=1 Tax=Copidosoma floridanum TaxID=29053 RepID=UPI0006C9A7E5|nr:uncharacterized protein LOC106640507 [Copidosoma floridanum]
MEARQFFTCSLSPLVVKTFAIKWSEDGRLSVVTREGVHIIEMIPAPGQSHPILNLRRSFIQSPSTLPSKRYMQDVLSAIFDWDKKDVYSFLMMDALTPSFPKASIPMTEICDIFWSPQDLLNPHACLIALLTSGGGVELAVQIDLSWFSICNVSDAWAEVIEADYEAVDNAVNFKGQTIKNQVYRLFATTATWSCAYKTDNACFAYLVTAHRNSELAIWKVKSVLSSEILKKEHPSTKLELKFNKKLSNSFNKISSLLWIQLSEKQRCLIIVGFFSGLVGLIKLRKLNTEIQFDSYSTCYSVEDLIPVDFLHVLCKTEKWLEFIVVKGMHIVTLVIDIYGRIVSMKNISSPGFSITGISIINSDMMLITTQDGQLCEIRKSHDQQDLICTPIKIDMPNDSLQYLGLAGSPNRVLFTLITSPSIMYDHLVDREPSSIFFFSLNDVSSSLNPLSIVYEKEKYLRKCWDCLELIKVNVYRYDERPSNLARLSIGLKSMSPYELRIAHWIMTIAGGRYKKNDSEDFSRFNVAITQSRSYLFIHSACNYLHLLIQLSNLTNLQKLSASLLRMHLEIWLAEEEEEEEKGVKELLTQRVKNTLESLEDRPEPEKCNFCNEIILEPWLKICPTGHKLLRCAITCLQVTCARYRSCLVCHEIFHPCLDEEVVVAEVRCPYCDLPACFKNEVIDETLKSSSKNLSNQLLLISKDLKCDKHAEMTQ